MKPDSFELSRRRLRRLREEHVSRLLAIESDALRTVDPARKRTISTAYKNFVDQTSTELTEYCARIRSEVLSFADGATTAVSAEDRKVLQEIAADQFDPSLYPKRFDLLGEAIERDLSRLGMRVDLSEFRLDLPKAGHSAGTTNGISRFLASLRDDLELLSLQKQRTGVEEAKAATPPAVHWTSTWGFWIGAVGVVAGVAGTYRAFVPSEAPQVTKPMKQTAEKSLSQAASPKSALKDPAERALPSSSTASK